MINKQRMLDHVLELMKIDSESFHEREIAERLKRECEELGGEAQFDDAGDKVDGEVGNLFVRFAGTASDAEPIFLSAHMDTVIPGRGVQPVVKGSRVVTDGSTILGADDKAGCSVIVEAVRALKESGTPHGPIEICFSICEEKGLMGAKLFDTSVCESKFGIVLDSDDPAVATTRGPAADRMHWTIHGRESHAGVEPEKGISALKIAATAIASVSFGRIDEETTSNIGLLEGAGATNIISKKVDVYGEARSTDAEKLDRETERLSDAFHRAVDNAPTVEIDGKTHRARLEEKIERDYEALDVPDDSPVVTLLTEAADKLGHPIRPDVTGGGCDANVYNARGIECVNLGCGMQDIHTVDEWMDIEQFHRAGAIVFESLKMIGEGYRLTR